LTIDGYRFYSREGETMKDEIDKRLWLLEKEVKAYGKKIDLLLKAVNSIKADVEVLLSVQKTWKELVVDVVENKSGK
jgi:uncharacterized FlaG/YvyC family protein